MRVKRLADGAVFEGTPDQIEQAVKSGQAEALDSGRVYNPEQDAVFEGSPQQVTAALREHGVLEGSHAHKVATTGKLETAARMGAQGLSLGFFDELQAALRAPFGDKSLGENYREARDTYRENDAIAREANPLTAGAAEIGGGIAGALLPIPGLGLAKGAGILEQGALGAKLGLAAGVGGSEADLTQGDVAGVATDAVHGAMAGGAFGLAGGALGAGIDAVGRGAVKYIKGALDPEVQRMLAMGATPAAIKRAGGLDRVRQGVQIANEEGVFSRTPEGHLPDMDEMLGRVETKLSEKAAALHQAVEGHPLAPADLDQFWEVLEPQLQEVIANVPPSERGTGQKVIEDLFGELVNTDGSIPSLWELKKKTGAWERSWNVPGQRRPVDAQLFRVANDSLDNLIISATAKVGEPGVPELNRGYAGLVKLKGFLADAVDKSEIQNSQGGAFKMSDYVRASALGAGVGALTGMPVVGSVAGIAGATSGAMLRSTSGRLARAKLGEMFKLGAQGEALHAGQQAQAVAQGAIPRTVQGVKQWIQQNAQMVPPELQEPVQRILRGPDSMAELGIRALMPMFGKMMAPSPYESELDGKITSPQDRIAVTQQIRALGLPPSVQAYKLSLLNKHGTVPTEVYAPQNGDYGEQLMAFNERLSRNGY